ncbi:acyl carrier protein [Agromyces arachidis]|uniref:acyl carrier protein n=1 Tax=Agromyces arachidis TaxID=766966 RepID=UPI00405712AA
MNETDARAAVLAALNEVAPEIETDDLDGSERLRQDLELDSLDFLRLLETLSQTTGVAASEDDYPGLTTVGALVDYVAARD